MRCLIILFIFFCAKAEAAKILFELGGKQSLVDVGPGGGVTTDATVLWDERKDGAFPKDAPVGYADRVVDLPSGSVSLVANPTKKSAKDAAEADAAAKDAQVAIEKSEFDALKAKISAETATAAEIRKAFKYLLKKIGE